jgi:hypothetical protein
MTTTHPIRFALTVCSALAVACAASNDGSLEAGPDSGSVFGDASSSGDSASAADAASGDDASVGGDASVAHDGGARDASSDAHVADAGTDAAMDQVQKLLDLTKNCTAASMVSQHVYPDPGSAVPNVPICALHGAVFFNSDMDIDCDGRATPPKCPGPDPSYQPDTAFHNNANQPLAAAVTPYVVIPNDFTYPGLDTTNGGNVIAVIYNHQLKFAVFGDTGPTNLIGEASYATAASLGIDPNPATGGVDRGVTYIVFVGAGTRPSDIENQTETTTLGQSLVNKLIANN